MFIFKRVDHLRDWIRVHKRDKRQIGFVPTMGALHDGHISLGVRCKAETDVTLVSIFVNPRQFNDPEDLKTYPRPIEQDLKMLRENGVDGVFLPDVEDIYPPGDLRTIDFEPGPAGEIMEGQFRPGHFAGMAEVVYRLLSITTPERLYMGQKDFQQFAIVRKLIAAFHLPVELVMCPTIREPNGLAMSSRNVRLSPGAREKAGLIYKLLQEGKQAFLAGDSMQRIKLHALDVLRKENFESEYIEVVDGYTLEILKDHDNAKQIVACCAVKVEGVRLIDNMIWKEG